MSVRKIVVEYLKKHGCDGLANGECECGCPSPDGLFLCEMFDPDHCKPAIAHKVTEGDIKTGRFPAEYVAGDIIFVPPAYPYTYAWGNNPVRAKLKGRRCRVVFRWKKMNSCLLEFENGEMTVTSRNAIRRVK